MTRRDPLEAYKAKRDFSKTTEPSDGGGGSSGLSFVVQKHWASRLHYDFRLEIGGTMKSWAVPKGPSCDPAVKRLAIQVEDHPVAYNHFEGEIPAGQYGAGKVIIWDRGTWQPVDDPMRGYHSGHLKFALDGHKLRGQWALIRLKDTGNKKTSSNQRPWLLVKDRDQYARSQTEFCVTEALPDSVAQDDASELAPPSGSRSLTTAPSRRAVPPATAKAATAARGRAAVPSAILPGAVSKKMPLQLKPQLATLVDRVPSEPGDWLFEIKYDGYRMLARISGRDIRLITRNGNDWTSRLPALAQALREAELPSGWYDGEIVVADGQGIPDFQALQTAFDSDATGNVIYFLFDLPFHGGFDLRDVSFHARRSLLQSLFDRPLPPALRFSEAFAAKAGDVVASACRLGLEGVIGKRKDSPYRDRRSTDWIKLKCSKRQEFVIGGYTDPKGSRSGIGALVLGVHEREGQLRYVGKVGTGFDDKSLLGLKKTLAPLRRDRSPFSERISERDAHWVTPKLLAEVSFGSWTRNGRIRHAVFQALRKDKPATDIIREQAVDPPSSKPAALPATLKITHPEREVDASSGVTKIELLRFYAMVAPLMMPHLRGRPVSLARAPDGVTGDLFFQKHLEAGRMAGVIQLPPKLDPEHPRLLEIAQPHGLLSAAQMNVIEFHTWNATSASIAKPDRMTFDLDPGEGIQWQTIQEAALILKAFLEELGQVPFVKTSGGKGLHIVVPLAKHYGWGVVKNFCHAIVEHLAATFPTRFVAKRGPRNRVGKIFIDYLRNGFGATTVCAWSVRARPGLGVSVPIDWDEVTKIQSSAQWNVGNIHQRLDVGNRPWRRYAQSSRGLAPALKRLR
ncbi:MAG: DNA ligase D [Porticoccaceae bacterium]